MLRPCPWTTIATVGLPSCVTPSLDYYQPRSYAAGLRPPEGGKKLFGQLVQLIHHGRDYTGTGISTRCPSTTPVGLALGPDSPWADWPAPGTLGLSAGKVLTCLIATHACILTPTPSTTRSLCGFTGCRTLPYPTQHLVLNCRDFGGVLEPRYIIGAQSLDQ